MAAAGRKLPVRLWLIGRKGSRQFRKVLEGKQLFS